MNLPSIYDKFEALISAVKPVAGYIPLDLTITYAVQVNFTAGVSKHGRRERQWMA